MYTREMKVVVHPFTRQPAGEEWIIGRPDTGVFLALPADAVEVLDDLAAGKTVGEAQNLYLQRHGETPDMEDFLGLLQEKGLVQPYGAGAAEAGLQRPAARTEAPPQEMRYHFSGVPESFARRLFGKGALAIYGLLAALSLAAVIADPSIVPGPESFYFSERRTLLMLIAIAWTFVTLFVHEMGHLLAARAVGVSSRLGVGHRMWVLVAETDLTGLWSVPPRRRYLPLLAGPLMDVSLASILLLLHFGHNRGWLSLQTTGVALVRAFIFVCMLRLIWQCFLFVRTDFYYAIANLLGCKNLLKDTQDFLRNLLARLLPFLAATDQSRIPASEMRAIRAYSLVWILGRVAAIAVLVLVTIPLLLMYSRDLPPILKAGYRADPYAFFDALILIGFFITPLVIGLGLWLASLTRAWRRTSNAT